MRIKREDSRIYKADGHRGDVVVDVLEGPEGYAPANGYIQKRKDFPKPQSPGGCSQRSSSERAQLYVKESSSRHRHQVLSAVWCSPHVDSSASSLRF